ncbi:hypothetical protein JJV70_14770 [Streptomyces sp. JJ66]|nr:hypothetical protein [Streptomyces sp. JJ66]
MYNEPRRAGTRVRLPEGDPDTGARTPALRPGRSLLTVVGVVVLLVAALAFATRGGGGDDSGPATAEARPTAPTGVTPVPAAPGTIPTGFPRTGQGAQSAAANYVVALTGDGMYNAGTRAEIVGTVYAADVVAERRDAIDAVYSDADFLQRIGLEGNGEPPQGSTFVSRANPIGTDLVEYDEAAGTATVAVWYVTLFGMSGEDSRNPVTEAWYTDTFQLQWSEDDWKVLDFDQQDGPTPVGRDQRASSAKEMAAAEERFGGLTYAR